MAPITNVALLIVLRWYATSMLRISEQYWRGERSELQSLLAALSLYGVALCAALGLQTLIT